MRPRIGGKRRRIKIGIMPQLIILVFFASLFSLLILAIVAGVYFSRNLLNLRADRLEVISQLKALQIRQSIQYIYYQVYWLLTRDSVTLPLLYYRAGNSSEKLMEGAQNTLNSFLQLLDTFALARLYNLDLNVEVQSKNNALLVLDVAEAVLYPLAPNASVPAAVTTASNNLALYGGMLTGPTANLTGQNASYFIGITLPVYSNVSIILSEPAVAGYLTVIANAQIILSSLGSQALTMQESVGYTPSIVKGIYSNSLVAGNPSYLVGFEPLFANSQQKQPRTYYPISNLPAVQRALAKSVGYATKIRSVTGKDIVMGFTRIQIDPFTYWSVLIEQSRHRFLGPLRKLTNIMLGVVIGIGVFMCLITLPLAIWFVKPITKLKEATEEITRLKNERAAHEDKRDDGLNGCADKGPHLLDEKRNSFNSNSTASTAYSGGIRLPGRIQRTKKFFKDELTELTEAFNIMAEELERQYAHLEDRVRMRTKELEASKIEAEAANEAKTVFIANISHELRTPLNGILGMTSIAMEETDHSTIQDSLKLIHRLGELLLHILSELLTFSKNTLKRLRLEKSNFQILEVVYQVKSIFGKLALDQRVHFSILLRPNVLRKLILFGDSNRLIQVVMNLVSNSLKFTPVDGSVDVSVKMLGEYDAERSKESNYEFVYVKEQLDEKESSDTAVSSSRKNSEGSANGYLKKRKRSSSAARDSVDTHSLVTISTAEYENNIFQSQFHQVKPLPRSPSVSSVADSGYQIQPPGTLDKGSVHDDAAVVSPIEEEPPETELGRNSKRNCELVAVGNLTNYELVKNGKAFRMRKFYKPKTWVVQIAVSDTGPGIEQALQEKVFEPFIQGDQTLSRSYGGTGLGLSICRQLAKMMNGTLTLDSTLGKGSTFIFTVPLPQVGEIVVPEEDMAEFSNDEFNPDLKVNRKVTFDVVPSTPQTPEEEAPALKLDIPEKFVGSSTGTANRSCAPDTVLASLMHMRILVAEDNLVNQEVIKRMFRLEGFTNITLAVNGAEAVDYVKESIEKMAPFDIIFMDVQMPKMDGLTATRLIRNNLRYRKPIIALTAFADESNVKECLACGMSGFLLKPIKRTNLRQIMVEFSPSLLSEIVTTPLAPEELQGFPLPPTA